jgi:uncharacterized membrane protein
MAFCPSCGAQVEGKFCAKCGSAVTAAPPVVPNPPPPTQISASGLDQNVASALCYLLGVLTGILFLVIEPYNKNKTIRFHAFQSIFAWLAAVAIYIVVGIFAAMLVGLSSMGTFSITYLLYRVVELGVVVVWVMLMYKAYNNEKWVLPVIGPLAEKQA